MGFSCSLQNLECEFNGGGKSKACDNCRKNKKKCSNVPVDTFESELDEEKPTRVMPKRRRVGGGGREHAELLEAVRELTAAVEGVSERVDHMEKTMKRVIRSEGRMARGWRFGLITELCHLARVMEGTEPRPWQPLSQTLVDEIAENATRVVHEDGSPSASSGEEEDEETDDEEGEADVEPVVVGEQEVGGEAEEKGDGDDKMDEGEDGEEEKVEAAVVSSDSQDRPV